MATAALGLAIALGFALLVPALARAAAGDLDPSFADHGILQAYFEGIDETAAQSVAIDSHQRIVVGGFTGTGVGILRYLPSGDPDPSFGTSGLVTDDTHFGAALAVASLDRIVVAGDVLARYKASGDPDPAFGGDGVVALPGLYASAVAVDSHARILVGGLTTDSNREFALARYLADGTPDSSFGTGGVTRTGLFANSFALYPSGRTIVAGGTGGDARLTLVRYLSDGTPDPSFGGDGRARVDSDVSPQALAIGPRGHVFAAGYVLGTTGRGVEFGVAALEPNGDLDRSFGRNGTVTTNVSGVNQSSYGESIVIDSQGRLVVGGYAQGNHRANFALVRYNPDSSLDRSFSGDGISLTKVPGTAHPYVNSLALDAQGRIVAAGGTNFTRAAGGVYEFLVGRYVGAAPPVVSITSGPSRAEPTNDPTPSFGFAADEFGSTYECNVDGSPFVACSSPHATRRLDDGAHTFAVRATDRDGLTGGLARRPFAVDTTVPTAHIRGPSRVKTHRRRVRVRFRLAASEPVKFKCKVDRRRFRRCSSPYRTRKLPIGRHRITIRAIDAAGNVGRDSKRFRIVAKR